MKLPEIQDANRYTGLYVIDFGDHSAVGFTAEEVAALLDSEANRGAKVYKIHKAYPDGRVELKGVRQETFQVEAGMFFYVRDEQAGQDDFNRLCAMAETTLAPARAKVQLGDDGSGGFVTALIYPAEMDDEFSLWLLDIGYRTEGAVEGGTNAVQRYYDGNWQILDRRQLWGQKSIESLQGQALHDAARKVFVR